MFSEATSINVSSSEPVLVAVRARMMMRALEFLLSARQPLSVVRTYMSTLRQHVNHTDRKLALWRRNDVKWHSPPES